MDYSANLLNVRKNQKGFTLIEVMVVVVILAILAAIVVPRIISRPEQAKITKAVTDINNIMAALDLYNLDNGFYPSNEQGLNALVVKPTTPPIPQNWRGYLKTVPMDPWDHPYRYLNPGQHETVDVFTYGETNKPGDKEIGNWNVDKIKP